MLFLNITRLITSKLLNINRDPELSIFIYFYAQVKKWYISAKFTEKQRIPVVLNWEEGINPDVYYSLYQQGH